MVETTCLGGNRGTDRAKDELFTKATCSVDVGFGDQNALDIVEGNKWKASFKTRSEAEAKRVLAAENVPEESIKWAKKILNL